MTSTNDKPLYFHTISDNETTFICSDNSRDFYYRHNGFYSVIDVRHSDEPSDYTNWDMKALNSMYNNGKYTDFVTKNVPYDIYLKAKVIEKEYEIKRINNSNKK